MEERVEAAVDVRHGTREGGLHLCVRLLDQGPQLAGPIADVLQLLGEEIDPLGQGDVLRQGPQVVVSQCPQLALQSTQGAGKIAPSLDLPRLRGVVGILVVPELDQLPPLGLDRGQPLRRPRDLAAQGGERGGGLPFPAAKAFQPEVPPADPSPFLLQLSAELRLVPMDRKALPADARQGLPAGALLALAGPQLLQRLRSR